MLSPPRGDLPVSSTTQRSESPAGLLAACARRATVDVVVDQPHRLHERVAGRGSDKGKAALLEILA